MQTLFTPVRALRRFFVIALLCVATPICLADVKERSFKLAFTQAADSHWGVGGKRFAELVDQKSGGKLKIRLYANSVLGGDVQTLSALQGGTVELAMMGTAITVGVAKDFAILDLPFLFNDSREADAVLDGPIGKKLMDKLEDKGLVGLAYWEHGFRHLTNSRRPVAKLEDIQGLKIRVIQAPLYLDMFNALGANAVPLPFPELYSGMEMKAVDGQENPLTSIEASKFYEVQKYLSTTRHVYNPLIVLARKKAWDQLSSDERRILMDAARETSSFQRKASRELEAKSLEQLKAKGMTVTEVPESERARMREKVRPVTEKYTRELGDAMVGELQAEIKKARAR